MRFCVISFYCHNTHTYLQFLDSLHRKCAFRFHSPFGRRLTVYICSYMLRMPAGIVVCLFAVDVIDKIHTLAYKCLSLSKVFARQKRSVVAIASYLSRPVVSAKLIIHRLQVCYNLLCIIRQSHNIILWRVCKRPQHFSISALRWILPPKCVA